MTESAKHIAQTLGKMSGRYSSYEIFADWIRMSALAIANSCTPVHGSIWKEREQSYIDTARRYNKEELKTLSGLLTSLSDALEEEITDVLGEVYMSTEMGNGRVGQFFTPFHLSQLTSRLALPDETEDIIPVLEPSCGSGGMIIATAAELLARGTNYQRTMRVIAQDLDWRCVHMCYVQLSLLGIRAKVVQGNTLAEPYDPNKTDPAHILRTPGDMGVLI